VVLDEPTNGLDPNQIVDIRTLIREIARSHSVLLSTHILSEIQATCDNVMMIEHGRMVFSGTMEDFDDYVAPDSFVIELGNPPSCEALGAVGDNRGVEQLDGNRFRVMLASDTALTAACISRSVEQGWDLRDIRVERCSLEETFARLSGRSKTQNTEKQS
jgi:ABC-2 type transport system ATP-binding protein